MAAMLSSRAVFLPYSLTRSLPRALWIRSLSSDSSENGHKAKTRVSSLLEKLKSSTPEPDLSTLSDFMKSPPDEKTPRPVEEVATDKVASPDDELKVVSSSKSDARLPTERAIEKTKGWKYNKVLREMRKDASREKQSSGDSKSGNLLGLLRETVEETEQDDGKRMLEKSIEETRRQKKKMFKSISSKSAQYQNSKPRPQWVEKTLEDLEKSRLDQAERSQKNVDPKLNQKIKDLLSEIEIAPKQMGTARTIVAAVENWGTTAIYQRKTIKDEYQYQTNEMSSLKGHGGLLLHEGERTGLFDELVSKAKTAKINDVTQSNFLYHLDELDKVDKVGYIGVRRNAFANQISLSNRLWQYPIDNEVCKVEEENTSFEEHVFLEYLLDDFPSKGPVRRFMELVVNGLQKNPYLSVVQKKERVRWFHDYFSNFSEEELNF
ncbi:uncharacterized protein LOC144655655 [Oculina patagonica]